MSSRAMSAKLLQERHLQCLYWKRLPQPCVEQGTACSRAQLPFSGSTQSFARVGVCLPEDMSAWAHTESVWVAQAQLSFKMARCQL